MRRRLTVLVPSLLIAIAGCQTSTPPQPNANSPQTSAANSTPSSSPVSQPSLPSAAADSPAAAKAKLDACALLTSKDIESVQGEAVKETKLTGQTAGGISVSQCFFTLPTFTNSVSLLVAQKGDGNAGRDPREFWRETFHREKTRENDEDRDREKKERGEEEEGAPPKKVGGIGDEAFWMGNRVGGALYVLKGNSYVRVSIGGPADQASKIKRSKALAQKAIARL
jgi:hypothetical protein